MDKWRVDGWLVGKTVKRQRQDPASRQGGRGWGRQVRRRRRSHTELSGSSEDRPFGSSALPTPTG